jgi:hypothetical protein
MQHQPLILTQDELVELTAYRQAARQRAWLDERRIPYRDEGRILVSRAAVERWLSGKDVSKTRPPRAPKATDRLNAGLRAWQKARRDGKC